MKIPSIIFSIFLSVVCFEIQAQSKKIDVDIEKADILDGRLIEFLKSTIVPIAKINNYNYRYSEISVRFGLKADMGLAADDIPGDSVYIVSATACGTQMHSVYWAGVGKTRNTYVATVDSVPVYLQSSTPKSFWFRPLKESTVIGSIKIKEGDLPYLIICDNTVEWYIVFTPTTFRLVEIRDWGFSWLKNKATKKYIPNLPIVTLKDEERKLPVIDVELIHDAPKFPDVL